jgi:hypothetical protein
LKPAPSASEIFLISAEQREIAASKLKLDALVRAGIEIEAKKEAKPAPRGQWQDILLLH